MRREIGERTIELNGEEFGEETTRGEREQEGFENGTEEGTVTVEMEQETKGEGDGDGERGPSEHQV